MEVYYSKMVDLGRLMMRGIALSLGLAENHFAPFCQNEVATLKGFTTHLSQQIQIQVKWDVARIQILAH